MRRVSDPAYNGNASRVDVMISQESPKSWLRKKLQMQGAQNLRSEAYMGGTPQRRR